MMMIRPLMAKLQVTVQSEKSRDWKTINEMESFGDGELGDKVCDNLVAAEFQDRNDLTQGSEHVFNPFLLCSTKFLESHFL